MYESLDHYFVVVNVIPADDATQSWVISSPRESPPGRKTVGGASLHDVQIHEATKPAERLR